MILSLVIYLPSFVHTSCVCCFQDVSKIEKVPMSTLPIICFRDGGPPLPDPLNITLNDSAVSGRRPRKHMHYPIVAMLFISVLDMYLCWILREQLFFKRVSTHSFNLIFVFLIFIQILFLMSAV